MLKGTAVRGFIAICSFPHALAALSLRLANEVFGRATTQFYTGNSKFRDDAELTLGYGAQIEYESQRFILWGGLTNLAFVTESEDTMLDHLLHHFGFNASVGLGRVCFFAHRSRLA